MPRYRTDNQDLIDKIVDLKKRITRLEKQRKLGTSALDSGAIRVPIGGLLTVVDDAGERRFLIYSDENYVPNLVRIAVFGDTQVTTMHVSSSELDGINQTYLQMYTDVNGANIDRGSLELFNNGAILSVEDSGVFDRIHIRNLAPYGTNGTLYMVGRWPDESQLSSEDALYTGSRSVSAGVSSVTISYPTTFASTIVPIIGLHSASGVVTWAVTAQSASSFTVAWSGTTAKIINMWNIRL